MGDVYMVNGKILSGLPNHAKDIIFDNDGTTLSSTNTEDAIKEVNSNLSPYLTQGISNNPISITVTGTSTPIGYTGLLVVSLTVFGGGWRGVSFSINDIVVAGVGSGASGENGTTTTVTYSFRVKSTDTIKWANSTNGDISATMYQAV